MKTLGLCFLLVPVILIPGESARAGHCLREVEWVRTLCTWHLISPPVHIFPPQRQDNPQEKWERCRSSTVAILFRRAESRRPRKPGAENHFAPRGFAPGPT